MPLAFIICLLACIAYLLFILISRDSVRRLLLDNPLTFHCNNYFVIGGILICLVSNSPMFLWISWNSCPLNLLLVWFFLPIELETVQTIFSILDTHWDCLDNSHRFLVSTRKAGCVLSCSREKCIIILGCANILYLLCVMTSKLPVETCLKRFNPVRCMVVFCVYECCLLMLIPSKIFYQ